MRTSTKLLDTATTLASLISENKNECVSYAQAISMAKVGTVPGVNVCRQKNGWVVSQPDLALQALRIGGKLDD